MPERDYPALLRSLADGSPPADGGDYATEAERAALRALADALAGVTAEMVEAVRVAFFDPDALDHAQTLAFREAVDLLARLAPPRAPDTPGAG